MERFDVRRGLVKEVIANGGLSELAREFFDNVEDTGENSFRASHGIMTAIDSRFENGALIVDVTNVPPDFDDLDAMQAAMDARKRWTNFLDRATGYNSKKRGDKAKEWAKKATKAKGQFVMAHHKWIKSVLDQMKEIKIGLKGYKYLDEAIELATELGLNITDHEIIRTNSTGLVIYNPKNLADRIKGMKNKSVSRKDKILARMEYEKQNSLN